MTQIVRYYYDLMHKTLQKLQKCKIEMTSLPCFNFLKIVFDSPKVPVIQANKLQCHLQY